MDYLELISQQISKAREKLTVESITNVRNLYVNVSKILINEYKKAKPGTFNQAWITSYNKIVQGNIENLNNLIVNLTKDSIGQVSNKVTNIHKSLFQQAIGLDIPEDVLNSMFNVPNKVINQLINGDLYKDGKGLSSRIWSMGKKYQKDVNYILTQGLAANRSYQDLAVDLEKYVNPNKKVDWNWNKIYPGVNKKVEYNSVRLIRTGINHAFYVSNISNARSNPFVDAMHWRLSDSHFTRQIKPFGPDECDDFAHQDDYKLGEGNFPVREVPVPHPNCLCTQSSVVTKSLEEVGKQLNSWLKGNPDSMLDAWWVNQ